MNVVLQALNNVAQISGIHRNSQVKCQSVNSCQDQVKPSRQDHRLRVTNLLRMSWLIGLGNCFWTAFLSLARDWQVEQLYHVVLAFSDGSGTQCAQTKSKIILNYIEFLGAILLWSQEAIYHIFICSRSRILWSQYLPDKHSLLIDYGFPHQCQGAFGYQHK